MVAAGERSRRRPRRPGRGRAGSRRRSASIPRSSAAASAPAWRGRRGTTGTRGRSGMTATTDRCPRSARWAMATRVISDWSNTTAGAKPSGRSPKPEHRPGAGGAQPVDERGARGARRWRPGRPAGRGRGSARGGATSSVAGSTSAVYPSSPSRWVKVETRRVKAWLSGHGGSAMRMRSLAPVRSWRAAACGRVAELGGGGEHAGAGLGRDRLPGGVVEDVADGGPRDPGSVGHVPAGHSLAAASVVASASSGATHSRMAL